MTAKRNKKQHEFIAILTSNIKNVENGKQVVMLKDITHVKSMKKFKHSNTIEVTKRIKDLIPKEGEELLISFTAQVIKERFKNSNRSYKKLQHVRDINEEEM